ncbi:MAG: hypothetical protein PHT07_10380 [Paludibacter sp.]|nr:hypothetical protein [Paludibacter sp.]
MKNGGKLPVGKLPWQKSEIIVVASLALIFLGTIVYALSHIVALGGWK